MQKTKKIYIAGHTGMVGSSILRKLINDGFQNLFYIDHYGLDLRDQEAVLRYFEANRPEIIIDAAARVGGIQANINYPATFLLENLQIQNNLIVAADKYKVEKFIFLGSSCIYPKDCPQPMREEHLMTNILEPTNEGYALAKIAGIKLLQGMKIEKGLESMSIIPCNLYGPKDSFDSINSHVLSALVRKFVDASLNGSEQVEIWGTGVARREFMHVDDLARAVIYFMQSDTKLDFLNVGTGDDISIRELADLIANKVNYKGKVSWDNTKPDGMLKKCMDVSIMKSLGFTPEITLSKGLDQMIEIYLGTIRKKED